jgi:hypothetical protein
MYNIHLICLPDIFHQNGATVEKKPGQLKSMGLNAIVKCVN